MSKRQTAKVHRHIDVAKHSRRRLKATGQLERAIPLLEQALRDRQRVLGGDHPDTLTSRSILADAYELAGQLGRAIPLYEQTLRDCERVLGPDHPETARVRLILAEVRDR